MTLLGKYKLKKDLPQLKAGVIFEHRTYETKFPDRGNPAYGVMILGWLNGACQNNWAGETYIMPGQLARDRDWFEPIVVFPEDQEKRVYAVDLENHTFNSNVKKWSDEKFMQEAEIQGNVWSLAGFEEDFNDDSINSFNLIIRIL